MSRERKSVRPLWVIGDSAGGTVVGLVFFVLALLMGLLAALLGNVWAWVLIPLTAIAIGVAIASIAYHRRHIPGFNGDDHATGEHK